MQYKLGLLCHNLCARVVWWCRVASLLSNLRHLRRLSASCRSVCVWRHTWPGFRCVGGTYTVCTQLRRTRLHGFTCTNSKSCRQAWQPPCTACEVCWCCMATATATARRFVVTGLTVCFEPHGSDRAMPARSDTVWTHTLALRRDLATPPRRSAGARRERGVSKACHRVLCRFTGPVTPRPGPCRVQQAAAQIVHCATDTWMAPVAQAVGDAATVPHHTTPRCAVSPARHLWAARTTAQLIVCGYR